MNEDNASLHVSEEKTTKTILINPIPTDENGKYLWIEIKGVEIIEITNYHGK